MINQMFEPQNLLASIGSTNLLQEHTKLLVPFTFKIDRKIGFRLYPDNRPRNMEIAALQKGIVLLAGGLELIEEGAGFGTPIAIYTDTTLFSSTAEMYLERLDDDVAVLTKVFFLDTVSKKQIHSALIDDTLYSALHKAFEKAYLNNGILRPFFDLVMNLRKVMGVKTRFFKVAPRGKVALTYHCYHDHIKIHVDVSALDKAGCREILLLNEQGATIFDKHSDCNGRALSGRHIGAWARVHAEQATFSNAEGTLSFTMENRHGASLFRGWERVNERFSWAGMTYSLNPRLNEFDYSIRIFRV